MVLRGAPGLAVWVLGLYPLARLVWWVVPDGLLGLGANPIERVLRHTGFWALVLLLVTLAVTPLRRITGLNRLIRLRRPLGLFAFFYATLHFLVYLGLDQFFAWGYIVEDVVERPFITVGFTAWLLLVPLAATSSRAAVRRLGRRWVLLHRVVYAAAALGLIHFYWRIRADPWVPLLLGAAYVALMALRMRWAKRPPDAARPAHPGGSAGRRKGPRPRRAGPASSAPR